MLVTSLSNKLTILSFIHRFFVVGNAIVTGYLVLSLTLSIFHIIRSAATGTRIFLAILDTVSGSTRSKSGSNLNLAQLCTMDRVKRVVLVGSTYVLLGGQKN